MIFLTEQSGNRVELWTAGHRNDLSGQVKFVVSFTL